MQTKFVGGTKKNGLPARADRYLQFPAKNQAAAGARRFLKSNKLAMPIPNSHAAHGSGVLSASDMPTRITLS
jgi:hypothetical protein